MMQAGNCAESSEEYRCMHLESELQKTERSSPILTCEVSQVRLCKYSLCARHAPSSDFNTCLQQDLPRRRFYLCRNTKKDKLFQHGMNATGLAVQSSHTGVAICNINTCKIHNVRQLFSNKALVQLGLARRPYFAMRCMILHMDSVLSSTPPSVRTRLHYTAEAIP